MAQERIGVYLCPCGPNIAGALDLGAVAGATRALEGVLAVGVADLLCSDRGRQDLAAAIAAAGLTRVVVGACSPREHEATFRQALAMAGLAPHRLQVANLREQCAWVTPDPEQATRKAASLVRAAVLRVREHQPLRPRTVPVEPAVLVVGAGVAGLAAATTLAEAGRPVHLVERRPYLGGRVARRHRIFPGGECGACWLSPRIDALLHHSGVRIFPQTRVEEVRGSAGRFRVRITQEARGVDLAACLGCGLCAQACPVRFAEGVAGHAEQRRALQVPFEGALPHAPVRDRRHCLRDRGQDCDACARACPAGAVDLEAEAVAVTLEVGAVILATGFDLGPVRAEDLPAAGWVLDPEELERLLDPEGPTRGELRRPDGTAPERVAFVPTAGRGQALGREILRHQAERLTGQCAGVEEAELLVVAPALLGARGAAQLAARFGAEVDPEGFLVPDPDLLAPLATRVPGVFAAGCALGPKGARASAAEGQGAAGRVLAAVRPGEHVTLEGQPARVLADRCSGCGLCAASCAADALGLEAGVATVDEALCRGCGACAAACPAGAVLPGDFADPELAAELAGLWPPGAAR